MRKYAIMKPVAYSISLSHFWVRWKKRNKQPSTYAWKNNFGYLLMKIKHPTDEKTKRKGEIGN